MPHDPSRKLKRIVLLVPDITTLGGVQIRTVKTMRNAAGRDIVYECLTLRSEGEGGHLDDIRSRVMTYAADQERVIKALESWDPADTVVIFPNNTLRKIDAGLRAALDRFPLVYVGSGQLAYHLQDSKVFADDDYCNNLKVTKIVLLSKLDKLTYNQFGCYGQIVGFNPVERRPTNTYSLEKNKYFGYVGRIDFYTRGADRLIDVAKALRATGRGPLKIFTVSNPRNSPQFAEFQALITKEGCADDVSIELDVTDLDRLFAEIGVLVLPSRKESFGNAILEAYSYGIPVISSAYAPGPASLIDHDRTGLLLESFEIDRLSTVFESLSDDKRLAMSAEAFDKHKAYGMEHYFDHLETVAEEAIADFGGQNMVRVYPRLRPLEIVAEEKARRLRGVPLRKRIKRWRKAFAGQWA